MSNVVAALIAVSLLLGLAGVAGGVYANFKSTALEASNRRLNIDNDYYLKKVAYQDTEIARCNERADHLERENESLRTLVNPATEIAALREQEAQNHEATLERLGEVKIALDVIHDDLQRLRP